MESIVRLVALNREALLGGYNENAEGAESQYIGVGVG
jgi:hypothetical protein